MSSNSKLWRVLVADDHALVREGICRLINTQTGMTVIAQAGDGVEAWNQACQLLPDVIVTDILMPKLTGLDLTRLLQADYPQVRVLGLSFYSDHARIHELMTAGASGYLMKRSASNELIEAIRVVGQGGTYLDPAIYVKSKEITNKGSELPVFCEDYSTFSDNEIEVLKLFAEGYTHQEIASILNISLQTVEAYKSNFRLKLGLKSRADIFHYVRQNFPKHLR